MPPKKRDRDPLLLEVCAAIGAGGIRIGLIHDSKDRCYVDGFIDGGAITINPAPAVVDTCIHECIHRLRPDWSERSVRIRTKQIMNSLTTRELETVYVQIMTTAKMRRNALVLDAD